MFISKAQIMDNHMRAYQYGIHIAFSRTAKYFKLFVPVETILKTGVKFCETDLLHRTTLCERFHAKD
ncbi:hypothetical protein HI914_03181 [Erysiphe necator]|nr:hypothetical protein HI914_03181 [Erysiphe necator]